MNRNVSDYKHKYGKHPCDDCRFQPGWIDTALPLLLTLALGVGFGAYFF